MNNSSKEWLSSKELAEHPAMPFSRRWLELQREKAKRGEAFEGPSWTVFNNRVFYHISQVEKFRDQKLGKAL